MNRTLKCIACLSAAGLLSACSTPAPSPTPEPEELVVFAAASLTETLTELKDVYEADHPGVTIIYNFESSGTLKTQIENGAECDIFISAAQKQMNQLDISKDADVNPDRLDFVLADTRIDLLENKVALAVPEGNPGNIDSYDSLAERLAAGTVLLAMGDSDVPVGQYTQKIFTYYGLDEEALAQAGRLSYGSNVKQVTGQVTEAAVDCGIIYSTDAYSAGLDVVDTATAEMCGRVIYPAAVLNITAHEETARDFLAFLTSETADQVFSSVGFTPVHE